MSGACVQAAPAPPDTAEGPTKCERAIGNSTRRRAVATDVNRRPPRRAAAPLESLGDAASFRAGAGAGSPRADP